MVWGLMMNNNSSAKIFISHSSRDEDLIHKIIKLLRASLNLKASSIRCTSVDGYRLSTGDNIEDQIRNEAINSHVFLGIISRNSFPSAWVLFELGARWGSGKKIMPLLANGFNPSNLKGPILGKNALDLSNSSQVHQLIRDVSNELNISSDDASSYQELIDEIVSYNKEQAHYKSDAEDLNEDLEEIEVDILNILAVREEEGSTHIPDEGLAHDLKQSIVLVRFYIDKLSNNKFISTKLIAGDPKNYCSLSKKGRKYLKENDLI